MSEMQSENPSDAAHVENPFLEGAVIPDSRADYIVPPKVEKRQESKASAVICSSVEIYKLCNPTPNFASYVLIATTMIPGMFGVIWYDPGSTENATSWVMWFTGTIHVVHRICYFELLVSVWTPNRTRAALYMTSQWCFLISILFTSLSPKMSEASLVFASFIGLAFAILGVPLSIFAAALGSGDNGALYTELQNAFNSTDAEVELQQLSPRT